MRHYYAYVYVRIMQALGAYGFRGFYERKPHFLQSVPYALKNVRWLLAQRHAADRAAGVDEGIPEHGGFREIAASRVTGPATSPCGFSVFHFTAVR